MPRYLPNESWRVGMIFMAAALGPIGGTNRMYGATPFTSAGVTNLILPTAWDSLSFIEAQVIFGGTVPTGTNTCTISIRKRKTDGTFVTLSTGASLFSRTQWDVVQLKRVSGATPRDWFLATGEVLVLTVDNTGGTITQQPVDLFVAAKCAVAR